MKAVDAEVSSSFACCGYLSLMVTRGEKCFMKVLWNELDALCLGPKPDIFTLEKE